MKGADRFIDTNVVQYLLSGDPGRANRAERELAAGGVVSVQVLNEFAAVALRKHALSLRELREFLQGIRELCNTQPLTVEIHERGLEVAERYGYSLYDSMIVAAALAAECRTLYSEDLQHGQVIDKRLTVTNPFSG